MLPEQCRSEAIRPWRWHLQMPGTGPAYRVQNTHRQGSTSRPRFENVLTLVLKWETFLREQPTSKTAFPYFSLARTNYDTLRRAAKHRCWVFTGRTTALRNCS